MQSIVEQLFERLKSDILEKHRFQAGEKLPGDRQLAKLYNAGRSSMISALKRLESERYIERIPVYGTFVRKDIAMQVELLNLALVLPCEMKTPEQVGFYNWINMVELMRGIFEESSIGSGIRITTLYCQEPDSQVILRRQVEDITHFDGAIFYGCSLDLLKSSLQATGLPIVVTAPKSFFKHESFPIVDMKNDEICRNYAAFLRQQYPDYKILLLDWFAAPEDVKGGEYFRRCLHGELAMLNAEVEEDILDCNGQQYDALLAKLEQHYPNTAQLKNKVICCMTRHLLFPLQHLLIRRHSLFDDNIIIAGFICDISFRNFHPAISYISEPRYELGRAAVKALSQGIRENRQPENIFIKPKIFIGDQQISIDKSTIPGENNGIKSCSQ
jgi:DNA-binding LacI/PurR family transcriptional regulator